MSQQHELTQIGKYQIVGQVGEGAMGVVYRAQDPVLNRPVAIKVMSDALARNDDLRGRFLREAQAAGSLQHPNVITIYDFGEVNGHLYIAMEFVEGEDLEDVLAKHVELPLIDKLDLVIDVLGGLAYAHKRGIVHRDIKPANIRIDEEGRARLMDFGIAHLASSNMTRTGVMVGTPAYMAPEQIVGSGIVPATDLFSVGAVLYELLAGVKPFEGDSLQNVMYRIVSQPTPPLATATLGLPAALDTIVQRALAKDVKDRYSSALEMANALTEVRAGLDRDAAASTTVSLRSVIDIALTAEREVKRRNESRRTVVMAASVGAVAIAATVVALFVFRGRQANPPTTQTAAAPSNSATPPSSVAPVDANPRSPTAPASTGASTQAGSPRPVTPPAPPKTSQASAKADAKPDPNPAAKASTADALVLARALQTTALEGRRRAVDAGATTEQLRQGDESNRAADALVARGKLTEAAAKFTEATSAWASAERDARLAASSAASRARTGAGAGDQPKPEIPAPTPQAPPPSAGAANTPLPPAAAAKLPAVSPAVEIEAAVAAYARAIESRDISEVRRAYPTITAAQARGFEQFFASVRSLRATFSLSGLEVSGSSADGKLTGAYDYLTSAGKSERQPVAFQANFKRDASGWKLAAVR